MEGWANTDAASLLTEACGSPVIVENDANAAAVGERLFGAGHSIDNFAMIYFGVGIGLGMIQNGVPFRGGFGNAGEIGHVVAVPHGRICACGQHGCLERYASVHALRERLGEVGVVERDLAALDGLLRRRDPVLAGWLEQAARCLSPIIAMIENILDPETVILGGMLPDAMIDELIGLMDPLPISVASRRMRYKPRVIRGQTGQYTAALGAASLPLFDVVTPKLRTTVLQHAD